MHGKSGSSIDSMHVKAVNIFGQLKVMQTIYKLYIPFCT